MPTRQQERSETTRTRLMDATVECLVELGWAGTTTTVVAQRAGVSRGAQLHHYPARADLVVAAVEHLGAARFAEAREAAAALPDGPGRTRAVLDMLAELRAVVAPLEAEVGRETHRLTVELLGVDESRPGVRAAIQQTLDMVRGLGISDLLTDDSARRSALLDDWAGQLDNRLGEKP